jgi:hypothetical protein
MSFDYEHSSGPFRDPDRRPPARLILKQVSDNEFAIQEGFRYEEGDDSVVVGIDDLTKTNLASIPSWLGWFMRRHGRHTAAALMHDHQVGESSGRHVDYADRVAADRRFRLALRASGVPAVRAGLMWTAVTLATRRKETDRFVLLLSWVATALFGMALLGWGAAQPDWRAIVAAILLPVPAGLFWERQWRAGIIAGYALPVVIFGSLPGIIAYRLYSLIERVYSWWSDEPPPTFNQR